MNIFVIDPQDISNNALMLDDRRLVKMVLETAQLLATAINLSGGKATYKTTHKNHPCSIWVRSSRDNYLWTCQLFDRLNEEYTHRYGKTHKCYQYRLEFFEHAYLMPVSAHTTVHPNCTPFKDKPVYEAYKLCMLDKWKKDKRPPKWSFRQPPNWFKNEI